MVALLTVPDVAHESVGGLETVSDSWLEVMVCWDRGGGGFGPLALYGGNICSADEAWGQ